MEPAVNLDTQLYASLYRLQLVSQQKRNIFELIKAADKCGIHEITVYNRSETSDFFDACVVSNTPGDMFCSFLNGIIQELDSEVKSISYEIDFPIEETSFSDILTRTKRSILFKW